MIRNLKALGLALLAALALSAVAAQAASAVEHTFESAAEKTHLTAKAENHQEFEATTGEEIQVVCDKVNIETGTGTIEGKTTKEVTAGPLYTDTNTCGVYEGKPTSLTKDKKKLATATIDTAGCHYKFQAATTTGNPTLGEHANVVLEQVDPSCETGITVKITAFQTECIHVIPQTIEHAVRYDNAKDPVSGKEVITVTATAHGIESETTHHPFICETPTKQTEKHTNGSYTGNVEVKGYSDAAHTKQVDVTFK